MTFSHIITVALLSALLPQTPAGTATPVPDGITLAQAGGADQAGGASARVGDLTVSGAWVRGAPPNAPVLAGYLAIRNEGTSADTLVAASAPFAGRAELHVMEMTGSMMQMAPVPGGIEVLAGETVTLAPGGLHIMFMDPRTPPVPGDTVPVTLSFEKAGSVTMDLPVSTIGAVSIGG